MGQECRKDSARLGDSGVLAWGLSWLSCRMDVAEMVRWGRAGRASLSLSSRSPRVLPCSFCVGVSLGFLTAWWLRDGRTPGGRLPGNKWQCLALYDLTWEVTSSAFYWQQVSSWSKEMGRSPHISMKKTCEMVDIVVIFEKGQPVYGRSPMDILWTRIFLKELP